MKKEFRKVLALLVISSIALSATACNSVKDEEIIDAADGFASAIASCKYKKISKLTSDINEDYDAIMALSADDYSDNQIAIISAIIDTIAYEVDEDSVEISKNSYSCDITFTMADYESIFADDDLMTDLDTCLDAIADAESNEITVTAEFEKDEDNFIVTNFDDFEVVYEFYNIDDIEFFEYGIIDRAVWFFLSDEDGVIYFDTTSIDLEISFEDGYVDPGMYYEVSIDDNVIYTGNGTDAWVHASDLGAEYNIDGYVAPGVYTITFYYSNGEFCYSDSCVVDHFVVDSNEICENYVNAEFDAMIDHTHQASVGEVQSRGWWDWNERNIGTGIYRSGQQLSYSMHINNSITDIPQIYYAYYYIGGTANLANVDYTNPLYENTIGETHYGDGNFYDIDGPSAYESGYYLLVVASDSNLTTIYFTGVCAVE